MANQLNIEMVHKSIIEPLNWATPNSGIAAFGCPMRCGQLVLCEILAGRLIGITWLGCFGGTRVVAYAG